MQDRAGFYKRKGHNNWNYDKFYGMNQFYERENCYSNNKKHNNGKYNKRQDNSKYGKNPYNQNKYRFYKTNQFYSNYSYYEGWNVDEQKILAMTRRKDLTEQEINNILDNIFKYINSGEYNEKDLSLMLENLAKKQKLHKDQISGILDITRNIHPGLISRVIQPLINNHGLQNDHISDVLDIRKSIGKPETQFYVLLNLLDNQQLENSRISDVLDIIKSIEEFKAKHRLLLSLIKNQKQKLKYDQISEILPMINDLDVAPQICVLKYLCQAQVLDQRQIDWVLEITSKFKLNQQEDLLQCSSGKQELSDWQIDGILDSNFVILKYLVKKQDLSGPQIDMIVFLISQFKLNQQSYMVHCLIRCKVAQLTDKHIEKILEIASNFEVEQIVKLIKEINPKQLPLFVLNSSLVLTRLEDDKNKDSAKKSINKIGSQKIKLGEQLRSLLETLRRTLNNGGGLSEEQTNKANDIIKQVYNIALEIITTISLSKQQVFVLVALIRGEKGHLAGYIDKILNKIGNFNLKELCCVLNFLISEQTLDTKHMGTVVDMIARGIEKSGTIKERIYVLDTFVYKNQESLMGEHIDKILKVIPKLIQEQQMDLLDNLGKAKQLNPEHISKILNIIKSYKGLKKERLLLEHFIDGKQLSKAHISTVLEIIKSYMENNHDSEEDYSFVLQRLIEQKQLELDNEQLGKILGMIPNLKSKEQSPVLQSLLKYGKQQNDQSLIDNIFKMVKKLEPGEQSFVLECFAKEELLTKTRIDKTLRMMTNWTSVEKRYVLVALMQYETAQMNKSRINAFFEIIKDLEPSDQSLVLECLAKEILLTEARINKILGMLQKQQSKNIKLTDEQCMFVVTALIKKQSLNEDQILKISRIIASLDIKVKRRLFSFGLLGYLIKDPEAKFKYEQICKILIETQKLDRTLNQKHGAKEQMTKCRGFFLKEFLDETIKKTVFKILKKYMPMAEDKQVNEISPEGKKVDTGSKISTKIENKNNSIFTRFKGNDKKPIPILGATVAVKKHQGNSPMLKTGNII